MSLASRWPRNSLLAVVLAGATAGAADEGRQSIEISALRDPVDKSYRKMVKGMDFFEEMHAMAPKATLRYKLLPRKRDTRMDGIALHVVADRLDIPVAVAPDHTFTLPRERKALAADAAVRSERRASTMTWRAEIRTPGLPPDTRRLGDLRLECLVGVEAGLISQYPSAFDRLFDLVKSSRGYCTGADVRYLFFSERPLFGVTLAAGARRETLPIDKLYAGITRGRSKEELSYCDCEVLLDRAYVLPLGDRSWPDDTRVELDYMDAPGGSDPASHPIVGWTRADVALALGEAKVVQFDSGFELWIYPFGLVALFNSAGVVAKTR